MYLAVVFFLMCASLACFVYYRGTREERVSYPKTYRTIDLKNVQHRFDVYLSLIEGATGYAALDHINSEIQQVGNFEPNVEAILLELSNKKRRYDVSIF